MKRHRAIVPIFLIIGHKVCQQLAQSVVLPFHHSVSLRVMRTRTSSDYPNILKMALNRSYTNSTHRSLEIVCGQPHLGMCSLTSFEAQPFAYTYNVHLCVSTTKIRNQHDAFISVPRMPLQSTGKKFAEKIRSHFPPDAPAPYACSP